MNRPRWPHRRVHLPAAVLRRDHLRRRLGAAALPRRRSASGALYASPLLAAGAGSNHGYDVVDPTRVSDERGGEQARRELIAAVHERGLRFVLDIVPNHVGVAVPGPTRGGGTCCGSGRDSEYAGYFDIDWAARPDPAADPGRRRGEGALRARRCPRTATELRYYEHAFPVAPGTADAGTARRRCTSASTTGWRPGARRGRADLPAVLRRLHAGRGAGGGSPRCSRPRTARCCAGWPRTASTGCGWTTRTGCPTRAATCAGCGRRSARTAGCWWRRSSASARRCRRPGRSTAPPGYEALREIGGRVRRPGRRRAAHPVRRRAHRPQGVAARGRARGPAGGGAHDPGRRGRPHRP